MKKYQQFQILHISDLHMKKGMDFERTVLLDPLLDRLEKDIKYGFLPEIVVVSGDIANTGLKDEYQLAFSFFEDLLKILKLTKDKIFIVPGNHDLDIREYRPSDIPNYETMAELNAELKNYKYRKDLFKGLENYFNFIQSYFPHLQSIDTQLVPFVNSYETLSGMKISLTGLNSAWMYRESRSGPGRIAIGAYQVKEAYSKLSKMEKVDLDICVFHHPLSWLWDEDRRIIQSYLNNTILLTGHLHEPGSGISLYLEEKVIQLQAGRLYLLSTEWPARFQYLTIDWNKKKISVDFRKFNMEKRTWILDVNSGDDGKKIFPLFHKQESVIQNEENAIIKNNQSEDISQYSQYLNFISSEHRHLPTAGFETSFRHPILLERVYINQKFYSPDVTQIHKTPDSDYQVYNLLNIKEVFNVLENNKIKDMLILGEPGSGKTLLLKYILISLAEAKAEEVLGISKNLIPFYISLHHLSNPDNENLLDLISNLNYLIDFGITKENLKNLLNKSQGIILLDGLDEVQTIPKKQVIQWIERHRRIFSNTRFIITSRFTQYFQNKQLEGNILTLDIRDFFLEDIKNFLTNWFSTVEEALHPGDENWIIKGLHTARELYNRIEESETLKFLAKTPLLLQIIALVHRDRGTLPERRVELFDECVNVLLEKWDMAKGLNMVLTARESRQILQPLALWLHMTMSRTASLQGILQTLQKTLNEIDKSNIDVEKAVVTIKERSNIFIEYKNNEYTFIHRVFQEYLAAEEIRNKNKIELLIQNYNNPWWREVILLSLSLANPSIIDVFIKNAISANLLEEDISLIKEAIKNSITKPVVPLSNALQDKNISIKTKKNIIILLSQIRDNKSIDILKNLLNNKNKEIADTARENLQLLNIIPKETSKLFKNICIKQIEIQNIKCFKNIEINVNTICKTVLLIGRNARGKSTILQLIALALNNIRSVPFPYNWKDVVMKGTEKGNLELTLEINGELRQFSFIVYPDDTISCIKGKEYLDYLKKEILFLGYGASRHIKLEDNQPCGPIEAVATLFGENGYLKHIKISSTYNYVKQHFEVIKVLINKVLAKADLNTVSLHSYDTESFYFFTPSNPQKTIPTEGLADGFKSTFVWLLDMMIRIVERGGNVDNADTIPGIILIDEIDLHLHPRWQRTILTGLKEIFPQIQFIVTTHSPFVTQSGIKDNLIIFEFDEINNEVKVVEPEIEAELSYESIVSELFNIKMPFSEEIERELYIFYTMVSNIRDNKDIDIEHFKNVTLQLARKGVEIEGVIRRVVRSLEKRTGKNFHLWKK